MKGFNAVLLRNVIIMLFKLDETTKIIQYRRNVQNVPRRKMSKSTTHPKALIENQENPLTFLPFAVQPSLRRTPLRTLAAKLTDGIVGHALCSARLPLTRGRT